MLDEPGVAMLVAEDQARLVGHTSFGTSRDADAGPQTGEIRTLFVAPSAWRHGVGTVLMRRALEELGEMGFGEATLWSFDVNERANAFYQRHGFRRDGGEQREELWAGLLEVRHRRPFAAPAGG